MRLGTPVAAGGAFDLTLATGTFAMQTTWADDGNNGQGSCEAGHPVVANGTGNMITVANPGAQTSTVGHRVSLQVHATDSATRQKLTYDASDLPAGLSINLTTGVITETLADAETDSVNVTATDALGVTGPASFTRTTAYHYATRRAAF